MTRSYKVRAPKTLEGLKKYPRHKILKLGVDHAMAGDVLASMSTEQLAEKVWNRLLMFGKVTEPKKGGRQ